MRILNALLRVYYAVFFAALACGFWFLVAAGHAAEGVHGGAARVLVALLPTALCFFFGFSAFAVARGTRPPTSTAAMAVLAVALFFAASYVVRAVYFPTPGTTFLRAGAQDQTKGDLGSLRSALSIYYGDTDGQYPAGLDALVAGGKTRSLDRLPETWSSWHRRSSAVLGLNGADYAAGRFTDAGGWYYVTDGPARGTVGVNCTHTDTRGSVWTSY